MTEVLQILDIVYFGSYRQPGGFYPDGVAGKDKTLLLNYISTVSAAVSEY